MPFTADFIRREVEKQTYEISIHADEERVAEGLTIAQVGGGVIESQNYRGLP